MRFLLSFAVLAALAMPAVAAPQLRSPITVDRDVVLLGDLFSDLPADVNANAEVARAPQPGRTATIDADRLLSIASANGLAWRPAGRFEKAAVERSGQVIGIEAIRAALSRALLAQGMPPDADVMLDNEQLRVTVANDRHATVGIEQLSYAPQRDRFTATLVAPADGPNPERVRVQGRVQHTVDVAVPVRAIQVGEVIKPQDLQFLRLRREHVGKTHVTTEEQLVGRSARRALAASQPVRSGDLANPNLVTRNNMIVVKVASDRMSLAMQAKVLEDGAAGDVVKVLNLRSNKIIQGTVTAPGEVTVTTTYSMASK